MGCARCRERWRRADTRNPNPDIHDAYIRYAGARLSRLRTSTASLSQSVSVRSLSVSCCRSIECEQSCSNLARSAFILWRHAFQISLPPISDSHLGGRCAQPSIPPVCRRPTPEIPTDERLCLTPLPLAGSIASVAGVYSTHFGHSIYVTIDNVILHLLGIIRLLYEASGAAKHPQPS